MSNDLSGSPTFRCPMCIIWYIYIRMLHDLWLDIQMSNDLCHAVRDLKVENPMYSSWTFECRMLCG